MISLFKQVIIIAVIVTITWIFSVGIVYSEECGCSCFDLENPHNIEASKSGVGLEIDWDALEDCNYSVIIQKIQGAGYYKEEFIAWDGAPLEINPNSTGIYQIKLYCNGKFIDNHIFAYELVFVD